LESIIAGGCLSFHEGFSMAIANASNPEIFITVFFGLWILFIVMGAITLRASAAWVANSHPHFGTAILITFVAGLVSGLINYAVNENLALYRERNPELFMQMLAVLPCAALNFVITMIMSATMMRGEYNFPIGIGKGALVALVQLAIWIGIAVAVAIIFIKVLRL
jgi:hypothetical protein